MIVRSYTGSTVDDALEKVRNDLGASALIIETRSVREPGLLGRRVGYEVVAAGDPDDTGGSSQTDPKNDPLTSIARRAVDPPTLPSERLEAIPPTPAPTIPAQAAGLRPTVAPTGDLSEELSAIRRQLTRLATGETTPVSHLGDDLATTLEAVELPAELIAELDDAVAQAGNRLTSERRGDFCERYLSRSLQCPGGIDWDRCRHLLVVGPTGVGKTTTLAKLAGELVLEQQRRVALVTIDTYRVGASEQLRTYADLLDVPFEIARSPAELAEVLERHADCDTILVDTAGRSPADTTRLHELRGFCKAAPTLQPMLTIAATCGRAEFARIIERFSVLPIELITVTKMDECVAPGRLVGCLRRHQLPVHYLTDGQEVPQDIAPATADRLTAGLTTPSPASSAA